MPDTWMAALTTGRAALSSGDLDTFAIHIDGQREVLLNPGRDAQGQSDLADVTAELVRISQSATLDEVLARLLPTQ
jgi:hypothetical protein